MIKTFMKLAKKLPTLNKEHLPRKKISMASIILNDKKNECFFLQSKIKQKCPFLTTTIQPNVENSWPIQ